MTDQIKKELLRLEKQYDLKILYAVEIRFLLFRGQINVF